MHKAIRCIVVMLALTAPAAALAQSDIPDLTGRWTIEAVSMVIDKRAQTAPVPGKVNSEFVIDWQDGARFSGREVSQEPNAGTIVSDGEQFAGIIGTDNTTIYLVDENGLRDCRVRSPDSLECVYRHILPD